VFLRSMHTSDSVVTNIILPSLIIQRNAVNHSSPWILLDLFCYIVVKVKFTQEQAMKAQKGTVDGVGGQRHVPAVLPPGMTRYPLCRGLDGPQGRAGRVRKVSHFTEM
jgi:hypothetical protein